MARSVDRVFAEEFGAHRSRRIARAVAVAEPVPVLVGEEDAAEVDAAAGQRRDPHLALLTGRFGDGGPTEDLPSALFELVGLGQGGVEVDGGPFAPGGVLAPVFDRRAFVGRAQPSAGGADASASPARTKTRRKAASKAPQRTMG